MDAPAHSNLSQTVFPAGNSEMANRIRAFDWASTSLGPLADWPQHLKTAVDIVVGMSVPMVLLWGRDGTLVYNDSYALFADDRHPRLLGATAQEGWPEAWEFNRNVLNVVLSGQSLSHHDEHLILNRSGTSQDVWLNLDYSPVRDQTGKPAGVLAIVVDTTEHFHRENDLGDSDTRFQTLANSIPALCWMADQSGWIFWYNQRWYDYGGVTPADMEGWGWQSMHDPTVLPDVMARWTASIATGEPFEMVFPLRRADGEYRQFLTRVAPVQNAQGQIVRWFGTNTDVTIQLRAEEQFRTLAEAIPNHAWSSTPDGNLNWFNSRVYEYTGTQPGALDGAGWATVVHPDDLPHAIEVWGNALVTGISYEVEFRLKRHDGAYRWYLARAVPVRDATDKITQWIGTNTDITRQRETEEAQRTLNQTLEAMVEARTQELQVAEQALRQAQKMEAIGQLTGGIAHDFNNMLAIVIGSLGLLKRRLAKGETNIERFADTALEGANRAASLTQRLLAFSRQQPLSPKPVTLNRLVTGMSEIFLRTIGETIRIETVLAGGLWAVNADPNQLESALLNLVVNARDAMPDGGKLTIETANTHLDESYVVSHLGVMPGQYAMIAISDSGAGMSSDTIAKAFDPFFTTKEVGKGTGLGLSQVYGFVRQSGGHVKIYSETGHGTTVKLYLPRWLGGADAADTELRSPAYADNAATILLVEDEDSVRRLAFEALTELGYRVLEAENATVALGLLDANSAIALLFTDIVMPEINGRQLAEEALRRRPELKVLFTTGYTRNAIVHNGVLDIGVELLSKPYTIEQLSAKIQQVLDGEP